jgi:hypothetical protein
VNYLVYFIWRQYVYTHHYVRLFLTPNISRGRSLCAQHPQYFIFIPGGHYDSTFALWCLFNSLYTTYALIWVSSGFILLRLLLTLGKDFLMDWSILRPHSRHFLLRQELIYTNHILVSKHPR